MKFSGPLPSKPKWLTTAEGRVGPIPLPQHFGPHSPTSEAWTAEETFVLHKGWKSDLRRLTKTNLNGFSFQVWICELNYHKIRRTLALNFSENYFCIERLYQTLERVFHQISWEVVRSDRLRSRLKKLDWASFFQPTSQCLDIWWNTLPSVSVIYYVKLRLITSQLDHFDARWMHAQATTGGLYWRHSVVKWRLQMTEKKHSESWTLDRRSALWTEHCGHFVNHGDISNTYTAYSA